MKNLTHYNGLADVFRYPETGYLERVIACANALKNTHPVAYGNMQSFISLIEKKSAIEIEELFGKTFHIQAICYLDLGYVLYAEDYKRGEFLVQMKNEQRMANNDCGVELADNLPNALTLLPLLTNPEFTEELAVRMYIPALEMMVKEFDTARIALKTKVRKKKQKVIIQEDMQDKHAYQYALMAILDVLQSDFNNKKYEDKEIKADPLSSFLPNCEGACAVSNEPAKTN